MMRIISLLKQRLPPLGRDQVREPAHHAIQHQHCVKIQDDEINYYTCIITSFLQIFSLFLTQKQLYEYPKVIKI